jgi:Holliday junction resolvase RusA-like endonuclease
MAAASGNEVVMIRFFVSGNPKPQGSGIARPVRRKGGKMGAAVYTGVRDESTPLGGWRARVAHEAARALDAAGLQGQLIIGPVAVNVAFLVPRPKALELVGKPATIEKRTRARPLSRAAGDLDKLVRAANDGLTGTILADDSQVVYGAIGKWYVDDRRIIGEWGGRPFGSGLHCPGAYIEVVELEE